MLGGRQQWMSVSDLMAGLMMVFMFIAIVFMLQAQREQATVRQLALTYQEYQERLYEALLEEFENDLDSWGAELLDDNTIRFNEPDILFSRSSSEINDLFRAILSDFFPRYVALLYSDQFRDNIDEIRLEGHTSSLWQQSSQVEDSYIGNARLSQERSLSVLDYIFRLDSISQNREWLTTNIRANGLSYSQRIMIDNTEDYERSRRVEFKVMTKSEERVYTILEALQND